MNCGTADNKYSLALLKIKDAMPLNYAESCKVSIEPLKLKLKDKFFNGVPCANLVLIVPVSAYFPNGASATICRVLDDCVYFSSLGEIGIIPFSSTDFCTQFLSAFHATLPQAVSVDTFGCCHDYVRCSDAIHCVHVNPFYSTGCAYRKNLEAGRIFYGTNKNV